MNKIKLRTASGTVYNNERREGTMDTVTRQSRLPRWMHHFYAWYAGYFWIPCPGCGQNFGGHEWAGSIPTERVGVYKGICRACTTEQTAELTKSLVDDYGLGYETKLAKKKGKE